MKVYVVTACYNDYEELPFVIGVASERYIADGMVADHEADYLERTESAHAYQKYGYTYNIEEWEVK